MARRRRYARYVRSALGEELTARWPGQVVGSEALVEKVRQKAGLDEADPEVTGGRGFVLGRSVKEAAQELAERPGVERDAWSTKAQGRVASDPKLVN